MENGGIYVSEISAPSQPNSGKGVIYAKDDKIYFKNDSGNELDLTAGGGTGGWTDAGTSVYLVTSTDKVGIGTTSPFSKTEISDTSWSSGTPFGTVLKIGGGATLDNNWSHMMIFDDRQADTNDGRGGSLSFARSDSSGGTHPFASIKGVSGATNYGHLAFFTRPDAGTVSQERMRIINSGNVGIGTTSPGTKLEVYDGDISINRVNTGSFGNLGWKTGGTDKWWLGLRNDSTNNLYLYDQAATTTRVTFDQSGNVGIGTTSPAKKLEVNGGDVYVNYTGGKLIMKSPDGSCSACGPTDLEAFACSSVSCP